MMVKKGTSESKIKDIKIIVPLESKIVMPWKIKYLKQAQYVLKKLIKNYIL
jgi:hypothetical protein